MNIEQIQEKLREIASEIGTDRERVSFSLEPHSCSCSIYTHGICSDQGFSTFASGKNPDEVIDEALNEYREKRATADSATTERMALAIISATHRYGECSKANLRCDFGGDADRLGEDAVALANSMSEAGPFCLTEDEGRNAA